MKIRTDFVTNSSSSSFIAIKVITKDRKKYITVFNNENTGIDTETHDGTFEITPNSFESIEKASDLIDKVYSWFYESLEDPECSYDETDEAFNIYGTGDRAEIRKLKKEDMRYVGIFSREEFWDEPYGASFVSYDYSSKNYCEEHLEALPDIGQDSIEELYERFVSETENSNTINMTQSESNTVNNVYAIGENIIIGETPWTVIAMDGTIALVLADKSVGNKPYNRKCTEVTWETCSLRKWLNEDYYKKLPEAVRNSIIEVENKNLDNPETGVSGGKNTKDKVFILSLDEINKYLPNDSDKASGDYWRTRTPGEEQRQALVISKDGSILDVGECWVEFDYGIRPAMWIKQ